MVAPILHKNEAVQYIYHQSAWVLAKPIIVVLAVLLVILYPFVKYGVWDEYYRLLFLLPFAAGILIFRWIFVWFLNRYIITSERLIKLAHVGLFRRLVIETPLERILNVSYKTTGLFSTLFHFGDVEVQVVGLVEPIVLTHIDRPALVKDYLWGLHLSHSRENHSAAGAVGRLQERIGYTKHNQRII